MKFKPKVKPYKHQRRGLQWIWQQKRGAFFWDPGTGKTKGAYDYVSASYLYRGMRRLLVVCPLNALQVWDDQADHHIVESIPFQVFIPSGSIAEKTGTIRGLNALLREEAWQDSLAILVLNYAAIIKRDQRWDIMKALEAFAPDMLIVDESHHIKGATTKQAKAVHHLAGRVSSVLLLTGTPIGKNNLDLYSQLKAVDPKIWKAKWTKTGVMSWTDFRNQYAIFGGRSGFEIKAYINQDDLERRYKPHIRSARKEDIHDMPKVTDTVIPVELGPLARRAYNIFSEEGIIVWRRHMVEAPIPLTKLLRLQQMTGGWVHDIEGQTFEFQTEKLAILGDLLADLRASDRSVLVFARFLAEIEAIVEVGQKFYKRRVYTIQGSVSAQLRRQSVQAFSSGQPSLMVIQVGAAEALDGLQRNCAEGIFYSSDYSLIHWAQARGRLDRVGQNSPVTFYHLHAKSTVDGLILQALQDKKDIEKLVMDNPEVLISR